MDGDGRQSVGRRLLGAVKTVIGTLRAGLRAYIDARGKCP